jgi:hypothetical protein
MSQRNKLKFQRGAAANTEFEDRNKGAEGLGTGLFRPSLARFETMSGPFWFYSKQVLRNRALHTCSVSHLVPVV